MYITDMYKILSVEAMFSFQEDDGDFRGEVVVRQGDVVGEIAAYLMWRTLTSCIISCDIVDI